ncbi:MAG TPA: hypothetical protein VM032_02525 [Vicinamibacterales bacterium]|nr:hypothetical protein [Vicinamibacterales bacterium]
MKWASRVRATRMLGAAVVATYLAGSGVAGHAQQPKQDAVVPASNAKDVKDADREPRRITPEDRLARQRGAMQRALFSSDETLPVTLIADFKAVNRDRNPESTKVFPATLVVPARNGGEDRIAVNIRTRGHSRRMSATCTFAPLRIEFPNKTDGTVFEGHKSLKLGTHCRDVDSYEQYVYREYLVYKIFNRVTARSFRARLTQATYIDSSTNKSLTTRSGLFLEDDDDVARRLGGETSELQNLMFAHVDVESMTLLALFEYMIGNTDMSLAKLHNIITVRAGTGVVYPVPYDFDYSGVVNARYAIPAKALNLPTVRERLYRGPCLTQEDLTPFLTRLKGMREGILSLYDSVPELDQGYRKDAKNYLDEFFKIIDKPGDAKRAFIDGCNRKTM